MMLDERPEIKRAFTTNTQVDKYNVILTIAIRDVAVFEMMIPKNKYDPFLIIEIFNKEPE